MHNSSDLSEGEIVEDFSEISSDEDAYFENLRQKLKARKEQLELENSIYGKSLIIFILCNVSKSIPSHHCS